MWAQKVCRIISFLFLLLLINGEGTLPAFLFDQIQRGWRPYDPSPPFSTPFDMNGEGSTGGCNPSPPFLTTFDTSREGSTPPCLLLMRFDAIGEGMTPPHSF